MSRNSAIVALALPLCILSLNPYENMVITSRWNESDWLWCDLVEIAFKQLAEKVGFTLPDGEITVLTVIWEKNLPPAKFLAAIPHNGTLAKIDRASLELFIAGVRDLYSTKHKFINLVTEQFATPEDKPTILRYTKEINLSGTVHLLRNVFAHRSLKDWTEIEDQFPDKAFLYYRTTRNSRGRCKPYLPRLKGLIAKITDF